MISTADRYAYADPDPERVLRIIESHGFDMAQARWFWIKAGTLSKIAQAGREARRVKGGALSRSASRRPTTPELEDRVIALARESGSMTHAAETLRVSYGLVRTIHRERGLPLPRLSPAERGAKGAATREARRALNPKDPAHA